MMRKFFSFLLPLMALGGILFAMQYWAVNARERDWWWFHGGPDHMAFADLHSVESGLGHIIIVEREPIDAFATEFEVRWKCAPKSFSWGDAWTKDRRLEQLVRMPAPVEDSEWHAPDSPMERRFVDLACTKDHVLPQTFRLNSDTSPVDLTEEAFSLVSEGVAPPEALQRARTSNAKQ